MKMLTSGMGDRVLSATNPLTVKYWAFPDKTVKKLRIITANRMLYYKRTSETGFWLQLLVEIFTKTDRINLWLFYGRCFSVAGFPVFVLQAVVEPERVA